MAKKTVPEPPHPVRALKAARVEQGLTLRALSARVGMPYSTLSKLENGKMELTYDKLLRLAQGLGVDLGALVAAAPAVTPPPGIGRRSIARARKSAGAASDVYAHQYPAAELLGKLMVPILIEVRVHSVDEMGGLVRHSGEEYLFVVSGTMQIHSDLYAPVTLKQGDSIYFDSGMAHAYVKVGDQRCLVLCVCAGSGIQRLAQSADRSWTLSMPADETVVSDVETAE